MEYPTACKLLLSLFFISVIVQIPSCEKLAWRP